MNDCGLDPYIYSFWHWPQKKTATLIKTPARKRRVKIMEPLIMSTVVVMLLPFSFSQFAFALTKTAFPPTIVAPTVVSV